LHWHPILADCGYCTQGLQEILEEDEIPKEWGGSRKTPFYNGEQELALFKLVAKNNGKSLDDMAIEGLFEPPEESRK
jgi:hypothetical protein